MKPKNLPLVMDYHLGNPLFSSEGVDMAYRSGYEKSAHLYDLFDDKENIEFFFSYANDAGVILDIGAGTGRIAIPLASRGIRLFCVEPSPAMRREFEKKLLDEPELSDRIQLTGDNAASLDLKRRFPAAFLSGSFDHSLDDNERLSSLYTIGRYLKSNGVLVFDVFVGLMKESLISPAGVVKKGKMEYRRYVGGRFLDKGTRETVLVFEIYQSEKLQERIVERSLTGIIDRDRIHGLLSKTGFESRKEFGDYKFTTFREGDPVLIIEALKKTQC